MKPSDVKYLVVHCSATPPNLDIGAKEIREWHKAKGWRDIGYHFVIRRDGSIEEGRPLNVVGSHVEGYNHESIGICIVGGVRQDPDADGKDDADGPRWDLTPENNFTAAQMASLRSKLNWLKAGDYKEAEVLGHRDFPDVHKACPSFDVRSWW